MKRVLPLIFICLTTFVSCSSDDDDCGTYNENTLFLGPEGGCYYNNSNGNKTYVDRSECNC